MHTLRVFDAQVLGGLAAMRGARGVWMIAGDGRSRRMSCVPSRRCGAAHTLILPSGRSSHLGICAGLALLSDMSS